jgi:hypothetical protein
MVNDMYDELEGLGMKWNYINIDMTGQMKTTGNPNKMVSTLTEILTVNQLPSLTLHLHSYSSEPPSATNISITFTHTISTSYILPS